MTTTRYFNGGRETGKKSVASDIKRIEIQKKGKFTSSDRYRRMLKTTQQLKRMHDLKNTSETAGQRFKRMMDEKLANKKLDAMLGETKKGFSLPGVQQAPGGMSKRAREAMKEIAMKKANKEAKALRKMVLVTPKKFHNGRITQKGQIFDVADNLVGKVNTKNGRMSTTLGTSLGMYKPKSHFTNIAIQDAINKYSPYYINLRKMQAMQQGSGGVWGAPAQETINLYGTTSRDMPGMAAAPAYESPSGDWYSGAPTGPRQNVGVTGWGVMSDNAWGTYSDNVWGGMTDNVWGGNSSNIWGGIGSSGGLWGGKGYHIWGTGNGKNYLRQLTSFITAFFGLKTKGERDSRRAAIAGMMNQRSSSASRTATAPRTGGSTAPRSAR